MDTDLEIIVKDSNIVLTPANVKAYTIMTLKGKNITYRGYTYNIFDISILYLKYYFVHKLYMNCTCLCLKPISIK